MLRSMCMWLLCLNITIVKIDLTKSYVRVVMFMLISIV